MPAAEGAQVRTTQVSPGLVRGSARRVTPITRGAFRLPDNAGGRRLARRAWRSPIGDPVSRQPWLTAFEGQPVESRGWTPCGRRFRGRSGDMSCAGARRGRWGSSTRRSTATSAVVVALKIIQLRLRALSTGPELFEQRFLAEARIASRLSHPVSSPCSTPARDTLTGHAVYRARVRRGPDAGRDHEGAESHLAGGAAASRPGWPRRCTTPMRAGSSTATSSREHRHSPSGEPKLMTSGIAKTDTARIKLTATGQFSARPCTCPGTGPGEDGGCPGRPVLAWIHPVWRSSPAVTRLGPRTSQDHHRVVQHDPPPPSHLVADLPAHDGLRRGSCPGQGPADRYPDGQSLART